MEYCRHNYNVDRLANDLERPVLRCLEFLKDQRFSTLGPFMFTSEHRGLKTRIGQFYQMGGFRSTIRAMLRNTQFTVEKRISANGTRELTDYIGEEVIELCIRIFQQELNDAVEDGNMTMQPASVTREEAKHFDLKKCVQNLSHKAPMFSHFVNTLRCVGSPVTESTENLFVPSLEEAGAIDEEELLDDDHSTDDEESASTKERRKRRNQAMIATMVSYGILFSRLKSTTTDRYVQVTISTTCALADVL
jgi:hypothetical protein